MQCKQVTVSTHPRPLQSATFQSPPGKTKSWLYADFCPSSKNVEEGRKPKTRPSWALFFPFLRLIQARVPDVKAGGATINLSHRRTHSHSCPLRVDLFLFRQEENGRRFICLGPNDTEREVASFFFFFFFLSYERDSVKNQEKEKKGGGGARKNESTNKKKPVKQNACLTSAYQWRVELACSALGLR